MNKIKNWIQIKICTIDSKMDAIGNNMVDLGLHYKLFKASNITRLNICFEQTSVTQIKYLPYFALVYIYPFLTRYLKFIYSEKATKFCEIFTLLLSYVVPVKSKVKIFAKFCGLLSRIYVWTLIYLFECILADLVIFINNTVHLFFSYKTLTRKLFWIYAQNIGMFLDNAIHNGLGEHGLIWKTKKRV